MSTTTTEVIANKAETVSGSEHTHGIEKLNRAEKTNGVEMTNEVGKTSEIESANVPIDKGLPPSKYLCLTILGYRKPGMSEEAFRRHMVEVSAPLTKDLMAKHGIKRWTVTHNPKRTRELMSELYDRQMANVADYDVFSQVVFESLEHYKNLKSDPWYKARLFGDHEKFADTERSMMTMGWIEEWLNDGKIRENMADPWVSLSD